MSNNENPYVNTLRDSFGESWSIEPWDARVVMVENEDGATRICPINQDTIAEIIEYFKRCEEVMNG